MELFIFGYSLISLQLGIMMQRHSNALEAATKPLKNLISY